MSYVWISRKISLNKLIILTFKAGLSWNLESSNSFHNMWEILSAISLLFAILYSNTFANLTSKI